MDSSTTINVTTLPVAADDEEEKNEEEVVVAAAEPSTTTTRHAPPRHRQQHQSAAAATPPAAATPSPRMLARREKYEFAFEDLYSSDRRKSERKIAAQASFDDARPSRAATNGPNPKFAVGLDTRELCLVQSTRTASRNGLI